MPNLSIFRVVECGQKNHTENPEEDLSTNNLKKNAIKKQQMNEKKFNTHSES